MKIKIKDNVETLYYKNTTSPNYHYAEMLSMVEGQTLDVDTEYLFVDQYNTLPIPGVSTNGMRIFDVYVEEVIDDERPGKARCEWCGKTSNNVKSCTHCNKSDYLTIF